MKRYLVVLCGDELWREDCDPNKVAGHVEFVESGEILPYHSLGELDLIRRFFGNNSPQMLDGIRPRLARTECTV
jgi:hypothetical protein